MADYTFENLSKAKWSVLFYKSCSSHDISLQQSDSDSDSKEINAQILKWVQKLIRRPSTSSILVCQKLPSVIRKDVQYRGRQQLCVASPSSEGKIVRLVQANIGESVGKRAIIHCCENMGGAGMRKSQEII